MTPARALIAGIVCLFAAQAVATFALKPQRAAFTPNADVFEALQPGEFAGTLMLGGFRGLACDLLWLRADSAKEQHRFYESVALYQTISRIQPRFEQIWQYMAHDMAYNIGYEVDDEDTKWAWYLQGVSANLRGLEHNPHSIRLLRHLGFMLYHKGDRFHARASAMSWAPQLNPVVLALNQQLPESRRFPLFADAPGLSSYTLGAFAYEAAARLDDANHRQEASYVRRMPALLIESDGNLLRNAGQHLAALNRWLDSLDKWQEVAAWNALSTTDDNMLSGQRFSRESFERNEGALRRRAETLARALAPAADADAAGRAISERRFADVRVLIARGGWKSSLDRGGIRWLDEVTSSP